MGRPAKPLSLTNEDRAQLESMARSQSLPAALSRRAQMILRMADGESNTAIARRYRYSRPTVTFWRTRFRERGIAGLHNELKPGRPRSTSDEQIATLINTALKRKPAGRTHWSRRSLAQQTGLPVRLLAEIEHGMRLPQSEHLETIAQALGMRPVAPMAAGAASPSKKSQQRPV